jgi:hypothetical protein
MCFWHCPILIQRPPQETDCAAHDLSDNMTDCFTYAQRQALSSKHFNRVYFTAQVFIKADPCGFRYETYENVITFCSPVK